jgi:hypothetical protein
MRVINFATTLILNIILKFSMDKYTYYGVRNHFIENISLLTPIMVLSKLSNDP